MKLIDSICVPGSGLSGGLKTGAGDDRYAFDEAAGWAAVIDGATDVGPVRLYPEAESDASHFADLFAATLLKTPSGPNEPPTAYFTRLTQALREAAASDARVPFVDAPAASLPTAAAVWVRVRSGQIDGASLGDAVAIVQAPDGAISLIGDAGKPADEQGRARKVMTMTAADRRQWLADARATHNRPGGYWIFGVQPEAAAHVTHVLAPAPAGARILLMTDGFYRLVSPYGRYDDKGLIEAASAKGLGALLAELRSLEADPGDDAKIGRFKTSDDATALLIEV